MDNTLFWFKGLDVVPELNIEPGSSHPGLVPESVAVYERRVPD